MTDARRLQPPVFGSLGEPGAEVADPRALLLGYLDWFRDRLLRKLSGLSDEQPGRPVEPLGWSPLGLVQHLGWVERRWMRWGFAAEDVPPYPEGGDAAEWDVTGRDPAAVLAAYRAEVERSRALAAAGLERRAAVGGRFSRAEDAPSLGRILVHLFQEYARHLGQLDVARQLVDGVTGE